MIEGDHVIMRKKLVLIQFSRALVPLMVMLFHVSLTMNDYFDFNVLGLWMLPMSGGVNYFFALSGFMIYYIYRKNLGQPDQLKNFLLNRFIRIYPLYWLLTLVLLPFLFIYPWYGAGHETELESILTSFLLIPNSSELEPILIVAWSLRHTVFFYLMFSLLFVPKPIISKSVLGLWAFVTISYAYGPLDLHHYWLHFIFDPVSLIFLGGILCAYLITKISVYPFISVLLSVIGLLGFPFMWVNSVYELVNIGYDTGISLASVCLIFGLASIDMVKDIKIPKFFNYLGNAAFSIYLSHIIILDFLAELFDKYSVYQKLGGWMTSCVLLVIMLIGGCLVHSYVEKPLIQKLKKVFIKKKTKTNKDPEIKLVAKEV